MNITAIIEKADTRMMKDKAKYIITRCWLIKRENSPKSSNQVTARQPSGIRALNSSAARCA